MSHCYLCGKIAPLKQIHLISKLFYNVMRKQSATGKMRELENPKLRAQDGKKLPFLCAKCEEMFSVYETRFNNIYRSIVKNINFTPSLCKS